MHYLVLLYGDEAAATLPGTAEFDAEMAGYVAFGELGAGAIRGGAALQLSDTTRTIRHDGGAVTVTDGPFAESVEALGGYYVLEADHLDDVIALVAQIPATKAPGGGSEIRPLMAYNDFKGLDEAGIGRTSLATLHLGQADGAAHQAFIAAEREHLAVGGALTVDSSASTVRVVDGEVVVSDGPFAEAIEVVGGFYLIDAQGDAAAEIAARIPMGDDGVVEVRPVMDLSSM